MGFMYLFVGMLFLFLDFRINSFDIIPDFIGYIFVLVGLIKNIPLNIHFKQAIIPAVILFILSFFELGGDLPSVGIMSLVVFILFTYFLNTGLKEFAKKYNNSILASQAHQVMVLTYLYIGGALIAFVLTYMAIIVIILGLITMIFQMIILNRASGFYDEIQPILQDEDHHDMDI